MNAIYMLMHQNKPNVTEIAQRILDACEKAEIAVCTEPWLDAQLSDVQRRKLSPVTPEKCDAILAVGGDGTILRGNALAVQVGVPLLGVNVGRVGFLTEVELEQVEQAMLYLKQDHYQIEERMMLEARMGDEVYLALNDVVVSRGGYTRLMGVDAFVNGDPLGRFLGDGLIVSSPTGSTGYSLSAGGPIAYPHLECMLITPICAHTLQLRPVVTAADQTVTVRIEPDHPALVAVDGQLPFHFSSDQLLTITRAEKRARFIRFAQHSFFNMIRIKLAEWSC